VHLCLVGVLGEVCTLLLAPHAALDLAYILPQRPKPTLLHSKAAAPSTHKQTIFVFIVTVFFLSL
jgi:hypothetical protein